MAKSKYSPALFEVMNRQKDTGKLGVPKWWKPGAVVPQAEPGEPGQTAETGAAQTGGPVVDEPGAAARPASQPAPLLSITRPAGYVQEAESDFDSTYPDPAAGAPRRFAAVHFESGQLHLTLGPTHLAVLCGAVLIVLIASYQLGRGFGGGPAVAGTDELTMLDQKPNPAVLEQPGPRNASAAPSRATAGVRPPVKTGGPADAAAETPSEQDLEVGLTYVVLDTYPPDAFETAEFVQKWLSATHNTKTVLRERKGKYWLIGTEGFDYSAPGGREKCDRYIQAIKDLGADCRKELIRAKLAVYGFASPMPIELTQ